MQKILLLFATLTTLWSFVSSNYKSDGHIAVLWKNITDLDWQIGHREGWHLKRHRRWNWYEGQNKTDYDPIQMLPPKLRTSFVPNYPWVRMQPWLHYHSYYTINFTQLLRSYTGKNRLKAYYHYRPEKWYKHLDIMYFTQGIVERQDDIDLVGKTTERIVTTTLKPPHTVYPPEEEWDNYDLSSESFPVHWERKVISSGTDQHYNRADYNWNIRVAN